MYFQGRNKAKEDVLIRELSHQVGQPYSVQKARQDIQKLFKTGLFSDIKVDLTGTTLTYHLVERPLIHSVVIKGHKKNKKE